MFAGGVSYAGITRYMESVKLDNVHIQQGQLERMLLLAVLLTKEIKSNATVASAILDADTRTIDMSNASMSPKEEGKRDLVDELVKYTAHSLFQGNFPYFRSIGTYLLTGNFNRVDFLEDLKFFRNEHEAKKRPEKQRAPEELLIDQYWKLTDKEFTDAVVTVLDKVEVGSYLLLKYAQLYVYFIHFLEKVILPGQYEEGLLAKFKKGIDIVIESIDASEEFITVPFDFLSDNDKVKRLNMYIKQQMSNKRNQDFDRIARELEYMLKTEPKQFVSKLYQYQNKLYFPLFKYFDAVTFVEDLFALDNEVLMDVRNAIVNRYQATNIGDFLEGDRDPLKTILEHIEIKNQATPASSLSRVLRERFADHFEEVESKRNWVKNRSERSYDRIKDLTLCQFILVVGRSCNSKVYLKQDEYFWVSLSLNLEIIEEIDKCIFSKLLETGNRFELFEQRKLKMEKLFK
ncbi:hypothetical protein AB4Z50_14390 [Paenibacillus sp. 2TAB26]|uniref:hypothetical protein n=1 Tax=Paenibacillus sp. 2TAB26 TaxID=3233005 RepID=UPI003F966F8A